MKKINLLKKSNTLSTPILFLVFNRPGPTKKVFSEIKKVKPEKLFIAADGYRTNIQGEKEKCQELKKYILENINWKCEVKTLFRKKNLGCGKNVSAAITWFFKNVKEGIILEDDCLPNQSFFYFCQELLTYYRQNKKIFIISGDNFIPKSLLNKNSSYYFSNIPHIWGWATWKRAWNKYNPNINIQDLMKFVDNKSFNSIWTDKKIKKYWLNLFIENYKNKTNTWCWKWSYAIWKNRGICITPNKNLISNLGLNNQGTHTLHNFYTILSPPTEIMEFPLSHPKNITINQKADNFVNSNIFLKNYRLKSILKKIGLFNFVKKIYIKTKNFQSFFEITYKKVIKNLIIIFSYYQLYCIYKKKRFQLGQFKIYNKNFIYIDSASFVSMYQDIFIDETYNFKTKNPNPLIIDCGANVGLSILYFKNLYPDSIIKAFEPDQKIFKILKLNCKNFNLKNVKIFNKGIWINNKEIDFLSNGSDGGRIALNNLKKGLEKIKTIRLKEILKKEKEIALLKIDIEGAEIKVLKDCQKNLSNVKLLFIEYHSFLNNKQKLDELLKILRKANFRYYINNINRSLKNPFLKQIKNGDFDLQLNIYAYRI